MRTIPRAHPEVQPVTPVCDRHPVTYDAPPYGRPVAVDLFAGVGGLGLGFEQAGFDVLAAVEYDPVHAATHLYNFPQTELLCRDVARVTAEEVRAAARRGFERARPGDQWDGQLDAVIGGPPCQGFSAGGKRELGDMRNELLGHFVRLVEELRPRTFCLENVSGLLESKFDDLRESAFRRLRSAGYSLSGTLSPLDSVHHGVPQVRKRVVVLGALDGPAPRRPSQSKTAVSVADAFEGLVSPATYLDLLKSDSVALSAEDRAMREGIKGNYARTLAGLVGDANDHSFARTWEASHMSGLRYTVHRRDVAARFAATAPGEVEPISRFYRLPLNGPSRTLRAGTGSERGSHTSPRPIHPIEPRVITVREAARLHGYPDWFRFHTTNWHGHRQIGNSVPPPLARAAARSLINSLGVTPTYEAVTLPAGDTSLLSLSSAGAQARLVDVVADHLPKKRRRSQAEVA